MNQKLLKNYYNPIIKNFTKERIENNQISIEEFIEWYKKFKKGYTSSKNIISVLTYLNSNLVDDFKTYIETDDKQTENLYKQCVYLGYKDTIKNMDEDVKKIKEKINNLTFNDAVSFCINNIDKFVLVANRIIILQVLGYDQVDKLKILKNERDEKVEVLRKISKNVNIRMNKVKEIDEHFGGIEKIKSMTVNELVTYIKKYRYKRIIMKVVEHVINNNTKIEAITNLLSHEYSSFNKVDFFFSKRPSKKLFEIYSQVMETHETRLKKTSSYVTDRLKDFELRIVNFLEYLDTCSSNTSNEDDNIIILFSKWTETQIYNILLKYGEQSNYDNSKVKSKLGKHHQAMHRLNSAISFLKSVGNNCKCSNYIKTLKTSIFLNQIENKSELLDWEKRRVYTDSEVSAMLEEVKDSKKDVLMITILREIGLRNSAICNLKLKDIVDEHRLPRHVCRVKEKGNKIREFVTSSNIKRIIVSYLHQYEDVLQDDFSNKYVFSRNKNLTVKMASATLNNILKKIALRAGVTNVNVQAHTFRHTLVGKLMDAGNNIETVSKFIGHSSVDTTMTYYWLKNISDLANEINNPFTKTVVTKEEIKEENEMEIEMLNKKIDTCFKIIGFYKEEIYKAESVDELKKTLDNKKEDINKILRYIAESVSGDTMSVYSSHADVRDYI